MTGIERLRTLAGARDEWILGGTLAEIAEQIERERDAEVADSPYDAILPKDREAIAWVREHGGIEGLSRLFQDADSRRVELCTALGIDAETCWSDAMSEMRPRLMPEGCEWPRYESGELVFIGDDVIGPDYGESIHVDEITFHANGFTVREKTGLDHWYESDDRFERPAILAADGEPLEVGQTVWHVSNGIEFTVIGLPRPGEYQAVKLRLDDGAFTGLDPDLLTHQRPVLDADGVPIHEGDTVWCIGGGEPAEVAYTIEADATHPDEVVLKGYEDNWPVNADKLTHTKPEIDTWQRIEEDAGCTATKYNERRGTIFTTKQQVARDLVRRAKALAERERGES